MFQTRESRLKKFLFRFDNLRRVYSLEDIFFVHSTILEPLIDFSFKL